MTTHSYSAARTSGSGSWTVTRSTDDGLTGGVRAHFSFSDSTVTSKLQLTELFADIVHQVSKDFVRVSRPAQIDGDAAHAFQDGADFQDQAAAWRDQGGAITYEATLAANNASTIVRSGDNAIGTGHAVLIINTGGNIKHEIDLAVRALEKALNRDGLRATLPSSFPTTGSVVV